MDEKMERFLKSIHIDEKDFNKFDMKFISLTKGNNEGKLPKYYYTILKDTHFDYESLILFLNGLNTITTYKYEFTFAYKDTLNEEYLYKFIKDMLLITYFEDDINILNINIDSRINIEFDKSLFIDDSYLHIILDSMQEFKRLLEIMSINLPLNVYYKDNEDIINIFNTSLLDKETYIDNKDIDIEEVTKINDNKDDEVEILRKQKEEEFNLHALNEQKRLNEEEKKEQEEIELNNKKRALYRKSSNYNEIELSELKEDSGAVSFKGKIYEVDIRDTKNGKKAVKILVSDLKGATYVTFYLSEEEVNANKFDKCVGKNIEVEGKVNDLFKGKEPFINGHKFTFLEDDKLREDNEENKRVELHLHTKMSEMDGVNTISDYAKLAKSMGMKAIAVTDHGVAQAFPEAQQAAKKYDIKMLYGSELYVIPDFLEACLNPTSKLLKDCDFVAFDTETTGLSTEYDRITEFGAVKIKGGMVVDRLDILINPEMEIPSKVVEKTHITNEMAKNCKTIKEVMPEILKFIGDYVLVSHNAPFDYEIFNKHFEEIYHTKFIHPVIDTIPLSRYVFPMNRRHRLGDLCKRLGVDYDQDSAHRADYDAEVLAKCWASLKSTLDEKIKDATLLDLAYLPYPKELYKKLKGHHACVIAKNRAGLKDLYKIISIGECDYIGKVPLVPKSVIKKYRKNLFVGSACFNGEVFESASRRSKETLAKSISFFDYIEIQPLENYSWLINSGDIANVDQLKKYLLDIINEATKQNKMICATGDCHYLNPEDKIYRDIIISQEAVGKIPHPLYPSWRDKVEHFENPDQHFRTTREMLDAFKWLNDDEKIKEYVITNTNKIADACEVIIPIDDKLYTPEIDNCENMLRDLCYKTAHEQYGDPLPEFIEERLKSELDGIINNGYSVTYWIAHELVRLTNEAGHIVGSRGSVGSSFAAYCAGITEVNALPPHYHCPHCKHVEFHDMSDGITSGYDLPEKECPECGHKMIKDGQNIPFQTFLGFHAEKVPDIDLNFPADFQSKAHLFTKDLLGADSVYRAGTISTVQYKTAFGYVRKYYERLKIDPSTIKASLIAALAYGVVDVKKTTGQHPGGIVVVPRKFEIYDFTPVQYPANDDTVDWKTTHFDFHAIHDTILKLDMLGHVDPQALKMMCDLANINIKDIPMDDKNVLSLFTSNKALKLQYKYLKEDVGTIGLPEFGTNFVRQLLREAKPKTFKDLLIVSGLSHGTDVWTNNAQTLISEGVTDINGVIGCRDDIMSYLISMGLDNSKAFIIMETVRKGKPLSNEQIKDMEDHNVPSYYIESCKKIKYLFPKGHACAYVMMALRVGYFKIYKPLEFYATFFTLRCDQYELKTMLGGIDKIHERIEELNKAKNAHTISDKEDAILDTLIVCLEFAERGFIFENIDINRSMPANFVVDKEHNALIPPFKVLDGLGENGSVDLIKAREEKSFETIDDFSKRSKLPKKVIEYLRSIDALKDLRENEELSLFDFAN